MVLDGASVKDNACIKEFAVVLGPKTVIQGNAKIGGRSWVFGDIKVGGNARILEAAVVSTIRRTPRSRYEGRAEITGNAVIKGDHFLLLSHANKQTVTGGVVMDYAPSVSNNKDGVFKCGRFCGRQNLSGGTDAGELYVNWQFNQLKTVLLEDSYVNNNGILYGRPEFAVDDGRRCIAFNGKDQYAEAPPSVADFGELTVDMMVKRSAGKGGCLFDFGTGANECFYLTIDSNSGKPVLTAKHEGKSYSLTASQSIAVDKWARVRIEMDGKEASIYVDAKKVAKGKFEFRPRDVFIGDCPEGNSIACGRGKKAFFKGRIDHLRIYRKVHDNFDAIGPVPSALTQIPESPKPDARNLKYHTSADWEDRTREEVEGKIPERMKKWLKDVRGY